MTSFPKLLVPMMFGQAIGIASMATIDAIAVLVAFVFTLFDLCFIVLLNDWPDRDVDGLKRRCRRPPETGLLLEDRDEAAAEPRHEDSGDAEPDLVMSFPCLRGQ